MEARFAPRWICLWLVWAGCGAAVVAESNSPDGAAAEAASDAAAKGLVAPETMGQLGIDPGRRAETLTLGEFAALANAGTG